VTAWRTSPLALVRLIALRATSLKFWHWRS
jgi:hypothetical protein